MIPHDSAEVFVGIDVAFAKKKRLPVAVCRIVNGRFEPLPLRTGFRTTPAGRGNKAALDPGPREEFCEEVLEWLKQLEIERGLRIKRIAIDSPSDYCSPTLKRRLAEQAMDRQNISCFATPTKQQFEQKIDQARSHLAEGGKEDRMPNANQLWMLVGFDLFSQLEKAFDCIEVFPQAIIRTIGCSGGHKSTKAGLHEQLAKFASVTGNNPVDVAKGLKTMGFGSEHDRLDALLSAWVASLAEDMRVGCGSRPNDVIWIPDISQFPVTGSELVV